MRANIKTFVFMVLLLIIMLLSACATGNRPPLSVIDGGGETAGKTVKAEKKTSKKSDKIVWVNRPIEKESVISSGSKKGPDYLMNFENITIPEFIEAMMSGVFKKNYLLSGNVKAIPQRFTIKMTEDLKPDRAFQLFKSILTMYNVSVTKRENTYMFDISKKASLTLKGPLIYGRKAPEGFSIGPDEEITFVVPFYNITPDTVKALIQGQLSPESIVFPIVPLNTLVINGNYEDIKYTLSFIELIDRAQFKDKSIVMIKPEYWDIAEFQEKIKMLLLAEGISIEAMEKTRGILFIPIEKLNSLIVISPVKEWVERVLYWLEQLDLPQAAGEAKKVYSYKLKNVEVESVADVLNAYRTGTEITAMGGQGGLNRSRGLPGQAAKTGNPKDPKGQKTTPRTARPGFSSMGDENAIDDVAIIPVLETNSIVVVATPVEYKKYLDIIKRIDVPRNQVFVEVIIGEVSLDTATQLGLEFWINRYLYNNSFGTRGGFGVYKGADQEGNPLMPQGANFISNGTLKGGQFEVLINALVENSKINIISTPKITVLENEEAEISVGADVPVIASETGISTGNAGVAGNFYPVRSVQYINTGIILKVQAAILSGNKIALQIEQEISEALENKTSDIQSPEILKRTIKTTMVVKEGEIAFIGGMFQNKVSEIGSGVPVLSKIPLLGNLFKNSKRQLKKTELVVFINSKTIRKSHDMKAIVDGVKKMFSDKLDIKEEK